VTAATVNAVRARAAQTFADLLVLEAQQQHLLHQRQLGHRALLRGVAEVARVEGDLAARSV
jgi:hypothetical protein